MESSAKGETQPKPRLIVCLGIFLASHHILFREMPKFIVQQMKDLGAEVCYHEFLPHSKQFHPLKFFTSMANNLAIQPNGTYTNFGINTIGIIRAPQGDGKEEIVLVTPYNSQGIQSNEVLSLALGFSVFSLLNRVAWLSKDIVWISADSQFGDHVQTYSNVDSSCITTVAFLHK